MQTTPHVYLISQGCTANYGEGEQMAGLISRMGIQTTENIHQPVQACLLNVCTVKGNGTALKAVREAQSAHPGVPILVTGCVPPDLVRDLKKLDPRISITSTHALDHVPALLQQVMQGNVIQDLEKSHTPKVGFPKVRRNPLVGIISISNGCLDACTFCSTRIVKGRLQSFPVQMIVQEAKELVADGCKELWLAGQDASCYGFDIGTNLAQLVQHILIQVPGDYHIRLGMGNPRHLLSYAPELVETCHDPRVFRFLHLPVQSGSDSVLAGMKRQHSVADYYHLVDLFRKHIPDITLSTDLIVGFPGETLQDFEATLQLIRDTRPSVCNRTRFVPRPGTAAARLAHAVHKDERKRRSAQLTEEFIQVAHENNRQFIGQTTNIVITEAGKRQTSVGHNECYRPVAVPGEYALGQKITVRIHDAEPFALLATPV